MYEDFLFLIPARGGSKGILHKNLKPLLGKPLIFYTLDAIKDIVPLRNICVSTDDPEIIQLVEEYGIKVPFTRPAEIATDTSTTQDVINHALDFYKKIHRHFKGLVLLQPTSPLRKTHHVIEAISLFSNNIDMIVSVKITSSNPYYILYEENKNGFLEISKKGSFTRRQDCPIVYERNGAIYIFNLQGNYPNIKRQIKYLMDEASSIDIDNELDWAIAEIILSKNRNQ
jgi:CMP-N,N'-diacetyllegionaminic acid synthase